MSDYERAANSTAQSIDIMLRMPDGSPAINLTALDVNAAYHTAGNAVTLMSLTSISSILQPWQPAAFLELEQAFAPGVYRLDLPDHFMLANPDISLFIFGPTIAPRFVVIAITPAAASNAGLVLADLRKINGVFINGAGIDGDEFQP